MRVMLLLLLLVAGCFGDPPAVATIEGTGGGTGGSDSAPPPTEAPTGAPGSATSTSGPPDTTDASDGSSSGASSSSSGGWASSSTAGTSTGDGSSSGGPPQDAYPPCDECPGQPCVGDPDPTAFFAACAPFCDGAPCPEVGWGVPTCLAEVADELAPTVCVLGCDDGNCSDGMECRQTDYHVGGAPIWACMWAEAS